MREFWKTFDEETGSFGANDVMFQFGKSYIATISFTVSGGLGTAVPRDVKAIRVRIAGE